MMILVDVDHVISDSFWRDPMIGGNWDEYHSAAKDDVPIAEVVQIVNSMSLSGHKVIGITVRPEKFRQMTMKWMIDNNVMLYDLFMRGDEDYRSAVKIKMELTQDINPDMIIDDREDVCRAFAEKGVMALQVHAPRRR